MKDHIIRALGSHADISGWQVESFEQPRKHRGYWSVVLRSDEGESVAGQEVRK
jgi:hypothetical protein